MKYRISTIGKIKSNDEDLITRKYLKRIKNIELKQYEIKTKNKEKSPDPLSPFAILKSIKIKK